MELSSPVRSPSGSRHAQHVVSARHRPACALATRRLRTSCAQPVVWRASAATHVVPSASSARRSATRTRLVGARAPRLRLARPSPLSPALSVAPPLGRLGTRPGARRPAQHRSPIGSSLGATPAPLRSPNRVAQAPASLNHNSSISDSGSSSPLSQQRSFARNLYLLQHRAGDHHDGGEARPQRVGSKIEETSAERRWSRRRRFAMAIAHGATATSSSICSGASRRPARMAAFSANARTAGTTWLVSGRQGFGSSAAGAAPGFRSGSRLKNPVAIS